MQTHPLDQTDQLILYLVRNLTEGVPHLLVEGGGVLTTMLAKLLFLVDVWSMQTSGSQVTDFRYIRYKYGPYPLEQFEERLEALQSSGLKRIPKVSLVGGRRYRIYRLSKEAKVPVYLSPRIKLLADEVMTTFANQELEEVLAHVYGMDFVRNTPFGQPINLESIKLEDDVVEKVLRLFKRELSEPLPAEHIAAVEQAQQEASNENIELARAMRDRQRKAFRLKEGS